MRAIVLALALMPTAAAAICAERPRIDWQDQLIENVRYLLCVVDELERENAQLADLLDAERTTNLIQTRRIETLAVAVAALRAGIPY